MKAKRLILMLLLLASAAGGPGHAQTSGAVLTSFYPMQVFTINVVKDIPDLAPALMLPASLGCPHDYALTPGDVAKITKSRALVVNGAMETFITPQKMKKLNAKLAVVNSGEPFADIRDRNAHESKGHKHKSGHAGHDHGEVNPHTWVSPFVAAKQVRAIGQGLAEIWPDHAQQLRANAKAYADRLTALGKHMRQEIAALPNKKIITFHDAFDYFARDLGLEVVGVIELAPGVNPTAKHMQQIIALTRQHKISTIFAEVQYPDDVARAIAREAGAVVRVLDPVASGDQPSADAYEVAMKKNLDVLKEALR